MQITAKLIQVLPLQTGAGKNGEWKKQDVIIETGDKFSKKICVSIWGDKINNEQLKIGNQLTVDFDVESREFNGRWYTDVKAWKIDVVGASAHVEDISESYPLAPPLSMNDAPGDDLPF